MNRYPVIPRQQEFLSAIKEYKTEYGRPPMIVDLARRFGMTRQSGSHIIRLLVRKGLVRMVGTSRHEVVELCESTRW